MGEGSGGSVDPSSAGQWPREKIEVERKKIEGIEWGNEEA